MYYLLDTWGGTGGGRRYVEDHRENSDLFCVFMAMATHLGKSPGTCGNCCARFRVLVMCIIRQAGRQVGRQSGWTGLVQVSPHTPTVTQK